MGAIQNTINVGKAMFEALQTENVRLREENAGFRQECKELQAGINALRTENTKLHQRLDPWVGYKAYSPIPGTTVYRFSPPEDSVEVEHFACPYCRDVDNTKVILQFRDTKMDVAKCPECRSIYRFKQAKPFFF